MNRKQRIRVLVLSEAPEDLPKWVEELPAYEVTLDVVSAVDETATRLSASRYDLVFLDSAGGDTTARVEALRQQCGSSSPIPVVVIADGGDEREGVECMKAGAYDYLVRQSLTPDQLSRAIRSAMVRFTLEEERNRLMAELRELSITDPLTGVGNRRFFMERLRQELHRSERTCRAFVLLMIDLDHFKLVNDRFGHQRGDEVLARCADILVQNVRKTDLVARYGGEEFCILLPETNEKRGTLVAGKLRSAVEKMTCNTKAPITVSIGVAEWAQEDTRDDLLRRADQAMYGAKKRGRNCVVGFSELDASDS